MMFSGSEDCVDSKIYYAIKDDIRIRFDCNVNNVKENIDVLDYLLDIGYRIEHPRVAGSNYSVIIFTLQDANNFIVNKG
jgi:hypothetical protein